MAGAVIGALRVTLGLDTAAFTAGIENAQRQFAGVGKRLGAIGDSLSGIGTSMSLALTAPIAAAGAGVIKMAGDFEASMNKVGISTKASAGDMKAMSALALQLGKDTTFSASTSADAMDMLAKNGLTAKQILDGAAKAALDLAAATGSQLDPAAAAITDTMQQFKMTTKDLPDIVNNITGAVNQSKLDFVDFQGAAAAAGGVAANVGVKFKDFTAVLAGISPLFASGSDAGTSFKTFLMSLGNPSSKAAEEIKRLGLSFYDAAGNLRPMAEIAEQLREKLGGLSDQAKTQSLATIFGTDGIRTALGLMDLGAKGLDTIKAKIAETDAAAQSAERLKGFNGQLEQLKGSIETLAIAIGNSGLLTALTGLVKYTADFIGKLSELNPTVLQVGTVIAGLTAIIGPVLIALASIANAVGTLAPLLGSLAGVITTTVIPILVGLGRALMGLAIAGGPLTLLAAAVTAAYLVWQNWDRIVPIVKALYEGVKTWLLDKLGAVFEFVKEKVKAVGDAFYKLWDRVVGHSYIPDMVDAIGDHLGRLQGNMVDVAEDATKSTAEHFADMAQSVVSSIQDIIGRLKSGDFLGAITGAIDVLKGFGLFGGKGGGWTGSVVDIMKGTDTPMGPIFAPLPGFATGGSFAVQGMRGIDRNVLQLNGQPIARVSHGEMVNVGRGGGAVEIIPSPWFDVRAVDANRGPVEAMGARAAAGGATMARGQAATAQRRRIIR